MRHRTLRRNKLWAIIAATLLLTLSGCRRATVYHHYESVSAQGWERADTLRFHVTPAKDDAVLHEEVELRINNRYPFTQLCLVVEQTTYPSNVRRIDTLNCSLIDSQGHAKGKGINYIQYNFHLTDISISKNDSLDIAIHHHMKRETLPGIPDLGIRLVKY